MAVYLIDEDNKAHKAHYVSVLTEPSSYDAYTPPADVQLGAVYYAQGERRVGTGKAFEFALYGSYLVRKITDSEGIVHYGVTFIVGENANVIFLAPSTTGDTVLQQNYIVDIKNGEVSKLGNNQTTGGEVNAYYDKDRVIVYLTDFSQKRTMLRFFVGKDNAI